MGMKGSTTMTHRALVSISALLFAASVSACGSDFTCDDTNNCSGTGGSGATDGGGATSGTGGSGNTSGTSGTGGAAGDGGSCDTTKSPSEEGCLIDSQYGVFVSPDGDDTSGDGTKDKPFKTLSKALDSAASGQKRVFACATAGSYSGAVNVSSAHDGVSLYGGFDCSTWAYSASTHSVIDGGEMSLLKIDGATGFDIEDFDVVASDAAAGSSIAVWINASTGVTLRRVKAEAGKGAKGADATPFTVAAKAGTQGNKGSDACSDPSNGGTAVTTNCSPGTSVGGKGGDGGKGGSSAGSGDTGQTGTAGEPGFGETLAGWSCAVGGTNGGGNAGASGGAGGPGGAAG